MENKYFMGDNVLMNVPDIASNHLYTFEYAKKTEDGWVMVLIKSISSGYGGAGVSIEYPVTLNETIELGVKMNAYVKSHLKPNKAGKVTSVKAMRIVDIDKYSVTIDFDVI